MEIEKRQLQWLEYDIFEPHTHVLARTFLRHGGSSEGPFSTLNVGDDVGDHPDSVKVNRSIVKDSIDISTVVYAKQKHGTDIEYISQDMQNIKEADGLITKEKGIALVATHADCQAAIFFDPVNDIIGVAHAGWKGLVQNIYKSMVQMFEDLGSKREDLIVSISPSVGPKHFEFKNYQAEFPKEFFSFQEKPNYFNLWEIAFMLLREEGIQSKNIEIVKTCTYENKRDYYSFRREKLTGRHATVVALKS